MSTDLLRSVDAPQVEWLYRQRIKRYPLPPPRLSQKAPTKTTLVTLGFAH
eukprot:SAG31_NODE_43219_length_268_cov_0.609467_1_plen_49_part_10